MIALTSFPSALYGEKCSESLIPFIAAMLNVWRSERDEDRTCVQLGGYIVFVDVRSFTQGAGDAIMPVDISPERGDA